MEITSGDYLKIKVQIAGRWYPLKIRRAEEQIVRKAVKIIEENINTLERNYDVASKQDLLAMCALQLANKLLTAEKKQHEEAQKLEYQLSEIYSMLESGLQDIPSA